MFHIFFQNNMPYKYVKHVLYEHGIKNEPYQIRGMKLTKSSIYNFEEGKYSVYDDNIPIFNRYPNILNYRSYRIHSKYFILCQTHKLFRNIYTYLIYDDLVTAAKIGISIAVNIHPDAITYKEISVNICSIIREGIYLNIYMYSLRHNMPSNAHTHGHMAAACHIADKNTCLNLKWRITILN